MKKIFAIVSILLLSISTYAQATVEFALEHKSLIGKTTEEFYAITKATPNFDFNIFVPYGKFKTIGHEVLTDTATGERYYLDATFEDNRVVSVTKMVSYSRIVFVFRSMIMELESTSKFIESEDKTSWFYKLDNDTYLWITLMDGIDAMYIMFMTKDKFKDWFPSYFGQKG